MYINAWLDYVLFFSQIGKRKNIHLRHGMITNYVGIQMNMATSGKMSLKECRITLEIELCAYEMQNASPLFLKRYIVRHWFTMSL